jgi:hypothetical protein
MNGIKWSKVDTSKKVDTVIIVCTGPSLKNFNFESLRDKGYIIAVNDAGKYVPFADAWFTLDPWGCGIGGKQYPENFRGDLFAAVPEDYGTTYARSLDHKIQANPKINFLHRIPFHSVSQSDIKTYDYLTWGFNDDRGSIHTGNSGFGAMNMAYHMRPKRIVLLGLDASSGYFFNENKPTRTLNHLPLIFRSTLPQLKEANIEVLNGSQLSKIDCFPRYALNVITKRLETPA